MKVANIMYHITNKTIIKFLMMRKTIKTVKMNKYVTNRTHNILIHNQKMINVKFISIFIS